MTREQEIAAVAGLIAGEAGFSIELFGILHVYQLEDGTFALLETDPVTSATHEQIFDGAGAAARAFIERRHSRQLGFDYESSSGDDSP
jgi:hypothetical protein